MNVTLLPIQPELRPTLPTIEGNVDYSTWQAQLERMDEILRASQVETRFVQTCAEAWVAAAKDPEAISAQALRTHQQRSRQALRCNLARALLQEDYRKFSTHLAESPLLQWFCGVDRLDVIRVPAKSTLQRYDSWTSAETIRQVVDQVLLAAAHNQSGLELQNQIELETVFFDSTCLKTNIHFPVDWVLLRDGVRTLIRAIVLIRRHGLSHRMPAPDSFLRRMNQLCIEMTLASRRAPLGKKARKRLLRQMKKMVGIVRAHARRYRALLEEQWEQTDWTRRQAEQVLRRIDGMLELLPQAQQQAHERIIGERPVDNARKILSLYETDTRVIVRGKAGAEVEFGNKLFLSETTQGLIVDYGLAREGAPADGGELIESLVRIEERLDIQIKTAVTDRGCDSRANRAYLEEMEIFNGMCPKAPERLKQRLQEVKFVSLQRRRAQTEGRIGILKNQFLGRPLRAKGFRNRERALGWAVLAHNLWVLARMPKIEAVARAA